LPQTDILFWIAEAARAEDKDETLWRCFLAGHFGRPSADEESIDSAGRFLCGFGSHPLWTWKQTSANLKELSVWLHGSSKDLTSLRFGNHRKYESKKPAAILRVIASFVERVKPTEGVPQLAFSVDASRS